MSSEPTPPRTVARRPLATRDAVWARALARQLARLRIPPNAISFASILFAAAGAWALSRLGAASGGERVALALVAGASIQLRLLMNLLDGLVAVEHGRKSATGDLWNEVPDRVADVALLVGAGYGAAGLACPLREACLLTSGPALGWAAAVAAVSTAYVRQLGGALGLAQDFRGPMAKQHRMFVLTLGALSAALVDSRFGVDSLTLALAVIVAGALVTCARRLLGLASALRARGAER